MHGVPAPAVPPSADSHHVNDATGWTPRGDLALPLQLPAHTHIHLQAWAPSRRGQGAGQPPLLPRRRRAGRGPPRHGALPGAVPLCGQRPRPAEPAGAAGSRGQGAGWRVGAAARGAGRRGGALEPRFSAASVCAGARQRRGGRGGAARGARGQRARGAAAGVQLGVVAGGLVRPRRRPRGGDRGAGVHRRLAAAAHAVGQSAGLHARRPVQPQLLLRRRGPAAQVRGRVWVCGGGGRGGGCCRVHGGTGWIERAQGRRRVCGRWRRDPRRHSRVGRVLSPARSRWIGPGAAPLPFLPNRPSVPSPTPAFSGAAAWRGCGLRGSRCWATRC